METLFNVNQAAFIIKVHPLTIRRYINEGKLKATKVGGNIRIKESDLQEFNKDFTPHQRASISLPRYKADSTKVFTKDDPLFRLEGRGARIKLSEK